MPRRELSTTGYYHITSRSAGKIALFEGDDDRRYYLRLLKAARDEVNVVVIAWVLMTDHVHLVVDTGSHPESISVFMHVINSRYTRYFNSRTGRTGTLFQGRFWSKPIADDSQLMATVHYVHMNPEEAGMAPMRSYRWSSYQEYLGKQWVVDTSAILGLFGSFEAFDSYTGSPKRVVRRSTPENRDEAMTKRALELAEVASTDDLRSLPPRRRDEVIVLLANNGASTREIARVMGIGSSTVSRILRRNR